MKKTYAAFAFPVVLMLHLLLKVAFPGWFAYNPAAEPDGLALSAAEFQSLSARAELLAEPVALPSGLFGSPEPAQGRSSWQSR